MSGRGKKVRPATPQADNANSGNAPASNRRLIYAAAILGALLLFTMFTVEASDSDFWWHLRSGQYIVQTHRLPEPDPFAYTTALAGSAYPGEDLVRRFNLTHEWLFQVLLYLIYAAGGFPAVIICRGLVLVGLCGTIALVVHRRTGGALRSLAAALIAGYMATPFLLDRPYLVSFLLVAVVIAILEFRRFVWALPPLFLIWANLHGGFIMGWAVLGAYSAAAATARFRGEPEEGDLKLWAVAALSVAASGLNPNFFHVLRVTMLYRESKLQQTIFEWKSPGLWPIRPFQAVLYATAPLMLWAWRRVRLLDWLLYVGFAAAAFMATRNVMLFGIAAPIAAMTYFPWKRPMPALAQWGVVAALLSGIGYQATHGGLQFHAALWRYPWGATQFIKDHHVTGRMINSYALGGFLIWRLWPLEKVFIDGRALSDTIFDDSYHIQLNIGDSPGHNASELIDKYGIDVAILDGFEYISGDPFLSAVAMGDPTQSQWKLVYQDTASALYMKNPPSGVTPIRLPYALAGLEQECQNYISHRPSEPNCAHGLAMAYLHISDVIHGRAWLEYYLEHKTVPDAGAEEMYRQLLTRRR